MAIQPAWLISTQPQAASRQQVLQRRRRRRHGGIHQPARGRAGRAERAARPWRQCRQRAAQSSRSRRCRRRCRRRSRCRGCEPMTPRRGGSTTTGIRCQPGTYYTAASPGHITFIHISPPMHIIHHPAQPQRGEATAHPARFGIWQMKGLWNEERGGRVCWHAGSRAEARALYACFGRRSAPWAFLGS